MGREVLTAAVTTGGSSAVRAYAHCYNGGNGNGSVAVLMMNLHPTATAHVQLPLSLGAEAGGVRVDYVFTGSTEPSKLSPATGLNGTGMLLNGQLLALG